MTSRLLRFALLALLVAAGALASTRLPLPWAEVPAALVEAAYAAETFFTCPMHPTIVAGDPGECPVCGMDLVEKEQPASHEDHDHAGHGHEGHGQAAPAAAGSNLFTCGMHPSVVQEGQGTCPICGMDLTPMKPKTGPGGGGAKAGTVTVDPVMVQNMGVRVAHVERGPVFRHIRTIGEVEVAEDEVSVVNLRFSGWIERIWVDETGQEIKKGQRLFRIYSPEVVAAQEEYLLAVGTAGRKSKLARAARRRLRLWSIPSGHIEQLEKSGNGQITLTVRAPRGGFVLHKNVVDGARVAAGQDLYRIGNLKTIWVSAEVYEFDAPWVEVGQKATMELSFQAGRRWEGRVAYIYPTLSPRSRTLRVRLEFHNPGINLKPGMFATVRVEAQRKDDVLRVPTEAILHSGERRIVFVSPSLGRYEPREVVTGLTGDNRLTEVLEGLEEGDAAVVSGQFLLDSESQLQEAVQKLLDARLQAKKGHQH